MKRWRFNPDRVRPRTAAERLARRRCAGVLAMLKREIKQEKRQRKEAKS